VFRPEHDLKPEAVSTDQRLMRMPYACE